MKCHICGSNAFFHYCYPADEEVRIVLKCEFCSGLREIRILGLTEEERKNFAALEVFMRGRK